MRTLLIESIVAVMLSIAAGLVTPTGWNALRRSSLSIAIFFLAVFALTFVPSNETAAATDDSTAAAPPKPALKAAATASEPDTRGAGIVGRGGASGPGALGQGGGGSPGLLGIGATGGGTGVVGIGGPGGAGIVGIGGADVSLASLACLCAEIGGSHTRRPGLLPSAHDDGLGARQHQDFSTGALKACSGRHQRQSLVTLFT
jgi:hypothetical protein